LKKSENYTYAIEAAGFGLGDPTGTQVALRRNFFSFLCSRTQQQASRSRACRLDRPIEHNYQLSSKNDHVKMIKISQNLVSLYKVTFCASRSKVFQPAL